LIDAGVQVSKQISIPSGAIKSAAASAASAASVAFQFLLVRLKE